MADFDKHCPFVDHLQNNCRWNCVSRLYRELNYQTATSGLITPSVIHNFLVLNGTKRKNKDEVNKIEGQIIIINNV